MTRIKRSARSASKQIAAEFLFQSVTDAKGDEPQQKARERLKPWLELANLLPPPPARDELQRYPLAAFLETNKWRRQARAVQSTEFLRRFEHSGMLQLPAFAASIDWPSLRNDSDKADRLVGLAREIAETLSALTMAVSPDVLEDIGDAPLLVTRLYVVPPAWRTEVWMRNGALTVCWVDPFRDFMDALVGTLAGVEAMRLGQCPVCNHFFASRKDQKACSKRCNAVRRVRDWRARQETHEYQRKLRTAGLVSRKRGR